MTMISLGIYGYIFISKNAVVHIIVVLVILPLKYFNFYYVDFVFSVMEYLQICLSIIRL